MGLTEDAGSGVPAEADEEEEEGERKRAGTRRKVQLWMTGRTGWDGWLAGGREKLAGSMRKDDEDNEMEEECGERRR